MKIPFHGKKGLDQRPKKDTIAGEHYNIITIPNVTALEVSALTPYINFGLTLNCLYLIVKYNQCFSKVYFSIINKFKHDVEVMKEWEKSIYTIREELNDVFDEVLQQFERGESLVTMDHSYIQEFKEQLLELKPIKIIENSCGTEQNNFIGVESLISDIKEEVKKGNRVSFKLMQELQSTIEQLSTYSSGKESEAIENAIRVHEEKADKYINLAIKAVDTLNVIYESAKKTSLLDWAEQIKEIISDFLGAMESFGIEEIKAEGMFFDGETMISIGSVPQDFAPGLEKYQVYSVSEKGFRYRDSGKLIREAKVTTIN